jgi:hypothetical protein
MSSFNTEAGLSMTSPAAILFLKSVERIFICGIRHFKDKAVDYAREPAPAADRNGRKYY